MNRQINPYDLSQVGKLTRPRKRVRIEIKGNNPYDTNTVKITKL